MKPGRLYGVGVGPGDPELITRKAARLIADAEVIAYHVGPSQTSIARQIAAELIAPEAIEEELRYPVTTGIVEHPGGYHAWLAQFYDDCATRLRAHLQAGRMVVVLAEGDPMFYGSFMYLHDRLSGDFQTEIVPGVTALSGATAVAAQALSRHEDTLTVLPGTLPVPELARRLADTDAAVIMKLGRTFAGVREALRQAGMLDRAIYVERATRQGQRILPVTQVEADTVPYMSIVVVPGLDRRADSAGRARAERSTVSRDVDEIDTATTVSDNHVAGSGAAPGTVFVVGLGPGPDQWLTPQAKEILGRVRHVVGYAPYVNRVPQRAGLTRHASGNTVEVDRARQALDLARAGESVAVVSGGDAGVFGMAAAVFEALDAVLADSQLTEGERAAYAALEIEVAPGVSAAQAAAALAGAPLGADFAIISLSDRLKPWAVVEDRLRAAASADLVMALYNPRSRSRPDQLFAAHKVLLQAKDGGTVVLIARNVGRPGQSLTTTTLDAFDPDEVDMSCLVIIGSSSTRISPTGHTWTPRWVEPHD